MSNPAINLKKHSTPRILQSTNSFGFTLIEILLVFAILGVLGGLFVNTLSGTQQAGRDVRRKSDLDKYKNSLELYAFKNNGVYPTSTVKEDVSNICSALSLTGDACVNDPKTGQTYSYETDPSGRKYVLWADLEKPSSWNNWQTCSSGLSGEADIEPTGGVCPLPFTPTATPTPTPGAIPTDTPTPTPGICTGGYDGGTDATGKKVCWFLADYKETGALSCNTTCSNKGYICDTGNWNDDPNCTIMKSLSGSNCYGTCSSDSPNFAPYLRQSNGCYWRSSPNQNCSASPSQKEKRRLCKCLK